MYLLIEAISSIFYNYISEFNFNTIDSQLSSTNNNSNTTPNSTAKNLRRRLETVEKWYTIRHYWNPEETCMDSFRVVKNFNVGGAKVASLNMIDAYG